MYSLSVWLTVIFFAWLLCIGSSLVYAYYAGWIGYGFLASLEKKKLYILLRFSRTSALLFISVSVIAFLYFETDVFPKKIPEIDVQITREQYENYLKQRYQVIGKELIYADQDKKEVLLRERSDIEIKLIELDSSYWEYIWWMRAHMRSLWKMQERLPGSMLNRAREAIAVGDMIGADLAIEQIENVPGIGREDAAKLAFLRGSLANRLADYGPSYEHYKRSTQIASDSARYQREAGDMAFKIGGYKASLNHYESALSSNLGKYDENNLEVAIDYSNLGMALNELGDYQKAYRYFEKALMIDLKNYPEDHSVISIDNTNLGLTLGYLREYRKAIPYFEKALAAKKNQKKDSPDVMGAYENLGWVWRKLDDYRRSASFYEKALAICLKYYGEDHINTAKYRDTLGWLWGELRQYDRSLIHYEKALNVYRKYYGEKHPDVLRIQRNLVQIKEKLKSRNS